MTTIFTDDFNPGGTTWNSTNWNTTTTGTSTSIDISTGRGRMTLPNGSGRAVLAWDKFTTQSTAEVLVKYEGMGATRNSLSVIGVACSGFSIKASLMSHGVWLKIPHNGNVTVQHTHTGSATQAGDLGINMGASSTNYWIRLKFSAGIIYVKYWADGAGEPGSWSATYDISGYASIPAGNVLLGTETLSATTSGGSVYFDDLTYGDGAATVVDINHNASVATSTSLLVDPVVTALPRRIATNFNNNVDPFGAGTNSVTHTASSGDLVVTTGATGNFYMPLTNFSFVSGGEMLMHVAAVTGTTSVGFAFGGAGDALSSAANSWIRARHNGSNVQYRKWADTTTEPSSWTTTSSGTPTSAGTLWGIRSGASGTITVDYFAANEVASVAFPDAVFSADVATATAVMPDATVSSSAAVNMVVDGAGTASALMVDPAFTNVTDKTVTAAVSTGSGLALDPTVTLVSNIEILAEPFTATGLMPAGGGFALPVTVSASVATASGEALDASLSAERNAVVPVTAMGGYAVLAAPLEAQNATDDPYYNLVYSTTDASDFWYRLDESSGSTVSEVRDVGKIADLVGTYSFGVFGPESRKAIHFENGYMQPQSVALDTQGGIDNEGNSANMVFEIVLRTTDANGVLAYGLDNKPQAAVFRNAIYLKDGKVSVEWNRLDGGPLPFSLTGFQNVADGQWHHIVVAAGGTSTRELDNGVRIYIDGKLDIRRRLAIAPSIWATPDSYMGMPDAWRNVTPLYPWQDNLTGDAMEVVFRKDNDISHDTAIELFYAVFGIVPIRVEPAVGFGQMPEAKGKGNRKKVLVLYTDWITSGGNASLIGTEANAPGGLSPLYPDDFDHDIQIGRIPEPGEPNFIDFAGFRVVPVAIMREDQNVGAGPYRDPVTDLPRLLNLQEDLNLDEYDLIMFRNWPDEGAEQSNFSQRGYGNDAIEDFLGSVKKAVVDGKGLEVTNINLASRLGLISAAQVIPMLYDRTGLNESDVRGAILNPWDEQEIGNTYLDLHANNWHRVVANIPNLTDVQGTEYISEAFSTYSNGLNHNINNRWGYKLIDGPLSIGTELLDITAFWNRIFAYIEEEDHGLPQWDRAVWAITPNGLLAGTPVYKFSNKMWQGNTEVDNPYRGYIGAAVVQPGDTWGGVRVAGKVFMNFAEAPWTALNRGTMTRQLVPPNSEIVNPLDLESAEKREWDYSIFRVAFAAVGGSASAGDSKFIQIENSDGTVYYKEVGSGLGKGLVGINLTEKYPTEEVVVLPWAMRGLAWLARTESVPSGSVVIRPTSITATGSMPDPAVVAEKSVTVNAQVALALGVLVNPDEVEDPDVEVLPFPAEGSGAMTGFGKTLTVVPFEGSGELVDNFELISAKGEQVVLYLHRLREVELYMEDK